MTASQLTDFYRDAVLTGFKVGGPILLLSIIVGLTISIIQAATSINEQTMTFVPKLIVITGFLVLSGGYMLQQMVDFFNRTFEFIATAV